MKNLLYISLLSNKGCSRLDANNGGKMMQFKKKMLCFILGVFCAMSLVACGKDKEEDPTKIVYEIGDAEVTYAEFYIYARTVEEDYQKNYGNGIWSLELETDNGKSSVKEVTVLDIISTINRVKVLVAQAEEMEITLSDNENAEAENAGSVFYSGLTDKDIEETQITRETVTTVIRENMLAEKVYNQVIEDYDFEISEEEARMTTFYDMVFECYDVKPDGSVAEYTEEKKATQLERANEALSSLAQEEDVTYASIVDKYDLEYAASYTMSKTDMIKEYGESITEKILALSDGAVSPVIESNYGYHIFKMIQINDEELTKENKEQIIAQMQKDYFHSVYEEWLEDFDSRFDVTKDVDMTMIAEFPFTLEDENMDNLDILQENATTEE